MEKFHAIFVKAQSPRHRVIMLGYWVGRPSPYKIRTANSFIIYIFSPGILVKLMK